MSPELVMEIGRGALAVTVFLAAPMLAIALALGLVIGMVQAATSIQEMTLSFIPKLLGLVLVLAVGGHWMLGVLVDYTRDLITSIPSLLGG
ncbi:flagellar biosynthesis protein FliQ [Wenzhouxiangella sp. XN24]|uniref:flagellar biosynthesis protein FliQ n=1 Tax=Wenzhouxiangella sp. XN24 TaxID=2713569 RepID=UPI0013ED2E66|nr:flagellar biosynthesis protein FliQ [Wenzhouxiangella sp. XN24]NGX16240.1 flagellar biosynthesis protein FliQ [Wenzhouxiangella sp. XN24]